MSETHEHRLKRLSMRAMRRGIKEMDIILSRYAAARLMDMNRTDLDRFDALLSESDHDLYQWVTGQMAPPERYAGLMADISDHAGARN